MKLLLLFSFDVSLKTWKIAGLCERELGYYQKLNKEYGVQVDLLTYGIADDQSYENPGRVNVIPC